MFEQMLVEGEGASQLDPRAKVHSWQKEQVPRCQGGTMPDMMEKPVRDNLWPSYARES